MHPAGLNCALPQAEGSILRQRDRFSHYNMGLSRILCKRSPRVQTAETGMRRQRSDRCRLFSTMTSRAGCQGRRSRAACSLYTEFGMVSPLPVPCKRSSDAPIPFGFWLSAARSHRTALPVVHRDVDARSIHIKSSGYNFHNGFLLKCFIVLLGCSFVFWRGG